MNIIISNTSDKPLYLQIKEQIKEAILKGELKDGDLLPSVRAFANDLGVSVLTTRRVYDELEAEGFAKSRAGLGTFVSMGNLELLKESKRKLVEEDMQRAIHNAKLFGITKEELQKIMDILFEEDE